MLNKTDGDFNSLMKEYDDMVADSHMLLIRRQKAITPKISVPLYC